MKITSLLAVKSMKVTNSAPRTEHVREAVTWSYLLLVSWQHHASLSLLCQQFLSIKG